jgi:hypothetical protein
MAQTTTISTKELERQAALVFEGETIKVMLCTTGETESVEEITVVDLQEVEVDAPGYVRFSQVIGTGEYSSVLGAYVLPDILASFTSTDSAGYTYDTVVIYIDGATYPHSIIQEVPNVVMIQGQIQTYKISIRQSP